MRSRARAFAGSVLALTVITAEAGLPAAGRYSPGNSPGCITHGGNVTLSSTLTLTIEIGGRDACEEYDRLLVTQMLNIQGAAFELVLLGSFTPVSGDRFDVLDWGTLAGAFARIDTSAAALPDGRVWNLDSLHIDGSVAVDAVAAPAAETAPVPPWTLFVLGSLLLGTAWRRRTSRSSANSE